MGVRYAALMDEETIVFSAHRAGSCNATTCEMEDFQRRILASELAIAAGRRWREGGGGGSSERIAVNYHT